MACFEGNGDNGVVAHIGEILHGPYAEFFVDDDIAGSEFKIGN
jgi:hypothetical protein